MNFEKTMLSGVFIIHQTPATDNRGYFSRVYCQQEFLKNGLCSTFVQSSLCFNQKKGTLRGLHAQQNDAQEDKLVACTRGRIFDVCVDVRENSSTYGKYISVELSEANGKMLYIPKGYAHGYLTLVDDCQLLYFMSAFYAPDKACGFRYDDPFFSIEWPIPQPTCLSEQDANWPYIGHR